ncbi:MAG TPA: PQQ-binding-like beta-propeller repeat protein [Ohtaekwangia sp.]
MKFYLFLLFIFLSSYSWAQNKTSSGFQPNRVQTSVPSTEKYLTFGDVKWKFATGGKIFSSPVLVNGVAYVGSEDGCVYAIDDSGKQKWKFKTGGAVHSTPAVHNQMVYFGSFDGYYYAVDAKTGREKWKVKTGGEKWIGGQGYFGMKPQDQYMEDPWDYFLSSPVIAESKEKATVYFGSSDGHLYAVDAESGSVNWKFRTGGIIHTTPLVYNHTVYTGSWDTYFYAIDAATGELKWKFKTGSDFGMAGIQASASGANDIIYFGARDAYFYALQAATGELVWKYDAAKSWVVSSAAINDDEIYVGTSDSFLLLTLDAKTGKEKSRFKANGYIYSSPAIAGNTVFFGDFTGKLFALDLNSGGKRWNEFAVEERKKNAPAVLNKDLLDFQYAGTGKDLSLYQSTVDVMKRFYSLGPIVSSPAVERSTIFFGSADGFLYAVRLKDSVD